MRLRNILILLTILLALGVYFYFFRTPEPPPKQEPRLFVWSVEMNDIKHIEIQLPRENKSEAFIKEREGDNYCFTNFTM